MLTTSFPRYKGDHYQIFVYELAKSLVKRGVNVKVVSSNDGYSLSHEFMEGIEIYRYNYVFPKSFQKITYKGGMPATLKRSLFAKLQLPFFLTALFLKSLKVCKDCDLIHVHLTPLGLIAFFLTLIHKKPVILTVLGSDVNLLSNQLQIKISKFIFNKVNVITSVSYAMKKKIIELNVKPDKVKFLPFGIDVDTFKPRPRQNIRDNLHLPLKKKIVLFVGLLIPVKGVNYLIDAIPDVLMVHKDAYFIFIGHGQLKQYLIEKAGDYGIKSSMLFVGNKPHSEIPYWLNASDILVVPSLSEGRPNVILEAMASEVPVVATNTGGIPELVEDGKNGFLVKKEDSVDLSNKISELLTNEKLRLAMQKYSRQSIFAKNLSWDNSAEEFRKIYTKLLDIY